MNALNLARDLESASAESGIPMVAVPQAADIYRISEETSLPIFAQHIDSITPGGHTGGNLIETLVEAGVSGSLINHSEKRMQLADIDEVIQLCKQHEIESCVCTNNIATSKAVASLNPDAVAVEPPELIGTGIPVSQAQPEVVEDSVNKVGVDVNTATPSLLSYVSGINKTIAKNIVAYRNENGKFKNFFQHSCTNISYDVFRNFAARSDVHHVRSVSTGKAVATRRNGGCGFVSVFLVVPEALHTHSSIGVLKRDMFVFEALVDNALSGERCFESLTGMHLVCICQHARFGEIGCLLG